MKSVLNMKMKHLVVLSLFLTSSVISHAGKLELVKGSVECLNDAENIMVELDCSKTTYLGDKEFQEFLKLARRDKNWEEESLKYFYEWFNDETRRLTAVPVNNNDQFKLIITVKDVQKSGRITADIKLLDTKTNKTEAIFFLSGSDGDANDKIPMRDPMKDAGETLGKYMKKNVELKK